MTTVRRLQAIARGWIEEGWQRGNPGIVDALHAPGFVDRSSAGRAPGREGFKEGIAQLYAAFPDFYCEVQDLVVDEAAGKVAVRWTATGTHRGPFMGVEPSGKRISFQGIEIIRIENEQIVERWGEWDGVALLRQLG